MDAGLIVRNDTGIVQIDSKFTNMAMVMKGTHRFTAAFQPVSIEVPPDRIRNSCIAIRATSPYANFVSAQRTKNGWFNLHCATPLGVQTDCTVEYFIFANPIDIYANNPGLRIRNQTTQELIFDSNFRYWKVLHTQATNTPGANTAVLQGFPWRKCAVVCSTMAWSITEQTNIIQGVSRVAIDIRYAGSRAMPDGTFQIRKDRTIGAGGVGSGGNFTTDQPVGRYVIVDVTGF